MEYNQNPRVLMCHYLEGKPLDVMIPEDCQAFKLSITTEGIGYTFNNANFWDMFTITNYTSLFAKIMTPKGFDRDPASNFTCLGKNIKVIYNEFI